MEEEDRIAVEIIDAVMSSVISANFTGCWTDLDNFIPEDFANYPEVAIIGFISATFHVRSNLPSWEMKAINARQKLIDRKYKDLLQGLNVPELVRIWFR